VGDPKFTECSVESRKYEGADVECQSSSIADYENKGVIASSPTMQLTSHGSIVIAEYGKSARSAKLGLSLRR
jgi:hypothetical protein